jgi:hypothetical protein
VRARLEIDGRELPALERIGRPFGEPLLLLALIDREPVLQEQDAVVNQQTLEDRRLFEKPPVLGRRTEAHDFLDAGAVVPTAIEQHHLAGRGQMRDVPLKVPLGPLAVGRLRERDEADLARIE